VVDLGNILERILGNNLGIILGNNLDAKLLLC
jgi:hypothetical protein